MAGAGGPSKGHSPDGGWGWVIVLSAFLLQGLCIGITYTFGILFVVLLEVFDAEESTAAWIGSIQPCLLYFTGILAGPLIKRFGWRSITILGSVISSIGFLSSSFVTNIYMLYLTYGVLTGIGNGMMYVTSMVAVQHYFDKRRAMATGIAVSGSGVGMLVFGFLTQYMLDAFGWQWTLRFQAAIILLGVICGALFRPLPEANKHIESAGDGEKDKLLHNQQNNDYGSYSDGKTVSDTTKSSSCCSGCSSFMREVFDPALFGNPYFILTSLAFVCFCYGYHVPFTYTPERAQILGVDPTRASFLVSVMGIANVAARMLFGWIGDRSAGIRFYLGGAVLMLGGISSTLISFFTDYTLMVVYCSFFAAFSGCLASLWPCILVDLMGIENIEKSLGQSLACGSISFLIASPISGWIIDQTGGNFDAPFWVCGGIQTLGGLIYFCSKCIRRPTAAQLLASIPITQEAPTRKRYVSESFT